MGLTSALLKGLAFTRAPKTALVVTHPVRGTAALVAAKAAKRAAPPRLGTALAVLAAATALPFVLRALKKGDDADPEPGTRVEPGPPGASRYGQPQHHLKADEPDRTVVPRAERVVEHLAQVERRPQGPGVVEPGAGGRRISADQAIHPQMLDIGRVAPDADQVVAGDEP